jgi:hypothetical protein
MEYFVIVVCSLFLCGGCFLTGYGLGLTQKCPKAQTPKTPKATGRRKTPAATA